jgi:dephospho-CoA kinase
MKVYALTGGTGSGKSEAGRRFSERGIPVIDADQVGHEVIASGGGAEAAVIAAFGVAILTGGQIDRTKLGAVVFSDAKARETLNGIVHPAIMAEVARRCAALAEAGAPAVLIDAALLGENGRLDGFFSGLVLISCPEEIRLRRLIDRRGMSAEAARRQIAAQSDPEKKRALATWVVDNSGELASMYAQVDRIAAVMKT